MIHRLSAVGILFIHIDSGLSGWSFNYINLPQSSPAVKDFTVINRELDF